jgi:hypothetical protein
MEDRVSGTQTVVIPISVKSLNLLLRSQVILTVLSPVSVSFGSGM